MSLRLRRMGGGVGLALLALALTLVVAGCSDEPATVEVADDRSDGSIAAGTATMPEPTAASGDSTSDNTGDGDGGSSVAPTSSVTTTTLEAITTTVPTTTVAPAPSEPTTSTTLDDRVVQLVGSFITGDGEFVRISDAGGDDIECAPGVLGVQVDGAIIHTYDDLSPVGGLRGFEGPRAQFAIVESCEEWTTRILFADFGVPPVDNVPEVRTVVPPDDIFFLNEFGWFGISGFLAAEASFYEGTGDGWNDTVLFDAYEGSVQVASDVIGWREPSLAAGVDYVAPGGWSVPPFDSDATTVSMSDDESGSWMVLTVHDGQIPSPLALAAETANEPRQFEVDLWESVDPELGRSRKTGIVPATETMFIGPDGTRVVRHLAGEDRTVEIELFVSAGIGSAYIDVPWYALEAVRMYDAVG